MAQLDSFGGFPTTVTSTVTASILLTPGSYLSEAPRVRPIDSPKPIVRFSEPMVSPIIETTEGTLVFVDELRKPLITEREVMDAQSSSHSFSLASEVREAMQKSGWTATEFGRIMDVDRVSVQNWLAGKGMNSRNQHAIVQITDILNRAERGAGKRGLGKWLITPSVEDGTTPVDLLIAKEYDKLRLRAMMSASRVTRIPGIQESSEVSPWKHLLADPD